MKTKNIWVVVGLTMTLFTACKKEKEPTPPAAADPSPGFAQLKTGNYWVYEMYLVDSNQVATSMGIIDSSYIEKDTSINGKIYYKKIEHNYPYEPSHAVYLRDSSGYIVDSKGAIVFASGSNTGPFNFTAIINPVVSPPDTLHTLASYVTDQNVSTTVGAGTFITTNFQVVVHSYPGVFTYPSQEYRTINHKFARGVGEVVRGLPFFSTDITKRELRLLRYHVE